jgi:glycosyltransferase involved in cell wall biosynthesis
MGEMRVGIFLSDAPGESGGAHTYEQNLLLSFLSVAHESHHEYVIFSKNDLTPIIRDCSQDKVPKSIVLRNSLVRFVNYFLDNVFPSYPDLKFSTLKRAIKKNNLEMAVFFCEAPEVTGCPFITPVWDLQHRSQPWFPEISKKGIGEKREKYYLKTLRRASFIITGTSVGKAEIVSFYGIPENRVRILPMPTPHYCLSAPKKRTVESIKKFHITGDYLVYPAQFWAHKNHINAILALKILRERYNLPLSLVFVGSDKGNLAYVQKITSDQKMTPNVHFLGFVSSEDLISLYQNAYALVFPTFFGPDNVPPLEAFALGCPVIASNVPGAEEQMGDAALFFDPKKPEEIARAVDLLYTSHSLRNTLIEKGYTRAHQWTGKDFIRSLFLILDEFESVRKNWE